MARTFIASALPTMAHAFGYDPVRMNVALTAYLLSLAVFIPASGKVADRFGTRTVFRAAIGLFTIGSIMCAQAPSLPFLVGALGIVHSVPFQVASGLATGYNIIHYGGQSVIPKGTRIRLLIGDEYLIGGCTVPQI